MLLRIRHRVGGRSARLLRPRCSWPTAAVVPQLAAGYGAVAAARQCCMAQPPSDARVLGSACSPYEYGYRATAIVAPCTSRRRVAAPQPGHRKPRQCHEPRPGPGCSRPLPGPSGAPSRPVAAAAAPSPAVQWLRRHRRSRRPFRGLGYGTAAVICCRAAAAAARRRRGRMHVRAGAVAGAVVVGRGRVAAVEVDSVFMSDLSGPSTPKAHALFAGAGGCSGVDVTGATTPPVPGTGSGGTAGDLSVSAARGAGTQYDVQGTESVCPAGWIFTTAHGAAATITYSELIRDRGGRPGGRRTPPARQRSVTIGPQPPR